jgi:hypothetical protein
MARQVTFVTAGHLAAEEDQGGDYNRERKQTVLAEGCQR